MRILLTSHFPLLSFGSGRAVRDLAFGLATAGHQVRCLCTGPQPHAASADQLYTVETVVCRPGPGADFELNPSFGPHATAHTTFDDLSAEQLAQYRDVVRRKLDAMVESFDPHIIHAQHAWVQGELVLETGVPYVLTVYERELESASSNPRIQSLATQSAENAGRIIVGSEALLESMRERFPEVHERIVLVPMPVAVAAENRKHPAAAQEGRLQLVYYGADAPWGVETLLNALVRLPELDVAADATVLVRKDELDAWELERKHRRAENVKFVDEDAADPKLLGTADLVIGPASMDERAESVALAAFASSTPVLLQSDNTPQWPLGSQVQLAAPSNHEDLAERIAAADKHRSAGQGDQLRSQVEQTHGLAATIPAIVEAYRSVLAERFGEARDDL